MIRLRGILACALGLLGWPCLLVAQQQPEAEWDIEALTQSSQPTYDWATGIATATNGVLIKYSGAVLTAQSATINTRSAEVEADGNVRIQQGDQLWISDHVHSNFNTHQIAAEQFRSGQYPVFAAGHGLHADVTNKVYYGTNAVLTTDDVSKPAPAMKVRARRIKIIPGKRFQAYDAVVYLEGVPVFYFPYYSRNLGEHASNFNFTPGYRSLYGPFLLGNYTWWWSEQLDGVAHLDYREKRGVGFGPDFNYNLGKWGTGWLRYYYIHDLDPNIDQLGIPIPKDRQRLSFAYQADPATNLNAKAVIRYQSDPAVVRDFYEGEYGQNPQPNTFFEVNRFWQNFSLDAYVQPRLNDFFETVERIPDLKLTGFRQQLGSSPFYYESESSAGYYRRLFAVGAPTNTALPGLDYEAGRADTFHQILLPETFFGWLNVTPRLGGRMTYYSNSSGPGGTNNPTERGVLNTGVEVTFKASRLWPGVSSDFFEVDGLRHIIQPSANYVFVPNPSTPPSQLPQFDRELPSLRLLPIDFPDYNAIDAIDSQNVIRWGLGNKLQTKRDGQLANLLKWDLYTDWRLQPRSGQNTFADIYSDMELRPRSWLSLESLLRYDVEDGRWRMSYHTLTLFPNNVWSWRLGHYYLRDDFSPSPTALRAGNNVVTSTMYYRFNENWGFRASHYFEAQSGRLQEQAYSVYRDLRSWTAALTFLARDNGVGPDDYTVAFTFSLKAYPHFGLGGDSAGAYGLLGQ